MGGWIVAGWLAMGILASGIGLKYDQARGIKIQLGNVGVALLGPIALLIVLCVVVETACTPLEKRTR